MNVICPKCKKTIQLQPDKLPLDKEKAMIKCPGCSQAIIFTVPRVTPPLVAQDRTIVDEIPVQQQTQSSIPVIVDKNSGEVYILKSGKNILGRNCDISLDDPYLSRMHCLLEVTFKNGIYEVTLSDDGSISSSGQPSTNGTFYNGTRLTKFDRIILNEQDIVKIGHTELVFQMQTMVQ